MVACGYIKLVRKNTSIDIRQFRTMVACGYIKLVRKNTSIDIRQFRTGVFYFQGHFFFPMYKAKVLGMF